MRRGFLLTDEQRARKADSSTSAAQQSAKGQNNTPEQQRAKVPKYKLEEPPMQRWMAKEIPGPTFVNPTTGHETQGPAIVYWEKLDE